MSDPRPVLAFVGMVAVGIVVPDIDLALPFLPHRSGLTHSALVPLVLLGWLEARQQQQHRRRDSAGDCHRPCGRPLLAAPALDRLRHH